jgi:streptogramin lyase
VLVTARTCAPESTERFSSSYPSLRGSWCRSILCAGLVIMAAASVSETAEVTLARFLGTGRAPGPIHIAGPDGALWFTEVRGSNVGRITTDGVVNEFPVGAGGYGITLGPDGALWFTQQQLHQLGRITSGGATSFFGPTTFDPYVVTNGPDGNLWFTEWTRGEGTAIGRLTPAGTITEFPVDGQPWDIAAGPDGNLWFTDWGLIGRIEATPPHAVTYLPLVVRDDRTASSMGRTAISGLSTTAEY